MSLVSIVMPSFNSGETISKSIISVIEQTYTNWELLIVDDCSTDNTISIINSFDDERIKLFKLNINSGSPVSPRNLAINEAAGDYISFLDSDDLWSSDKLETQISNMTSNGYFISHSSYHRIDEFDVPLNVVSAPSVVSFDRLLYGNCIGNLTGIYNCKVLGKFYQKNIGHEDYLMWLEILSKNNSIGITKPLASYRVLSKSVSSNKFRALYWHYNILRNELKINPFKACYYMCFYLFNAFTKRL
ncbi:glycosyltransferase family 2 protein [Shewanella colwelliana]|uniref:glycosyltransferase family 2 protein n=1 Tax=Shewanella colwelliana TaxID=23 RepID=UPI003D029121